MGPVLASIPDGEDAVPKTNIEATKAQRELGLQLTPVATTVRDMADSLITLGFANVAAA